MQQSEDTELVEDISDDYRYSLLFIEAHLRVLALHTARYPEHRELFLQMVRDVVAILMSTESLMLPREGLDAIEAFLPGGQGLLAG